MKRISQVFSYKKWTLTLFEFYLSYQEHREIGAAQGVKIAAKELEKTVAGLNLLVANHQDEIEICKEEMEKRLQSALQSFKVKDRGVFVQASTLGSLEALLAFLKDSKISGQLNFFLKFLSNTFDSFSHSDLSLSNVNLSPFSIFLIKGFNS